MPLRVVIRKDTGALTIDGRVNGKRYQRRAQSQTIALAREEAAAWEAEILRTAWYGERSGVHTFGEAVIKYLEAKLRTDVTRAMLERLINAIGPSTPLKDIDQDTISRLRGGIFASASEATILRHAITPLRAVLRYVSKGKMKWCDPPDFETPRIIEGRTLFFLPAQAELLIAALSPHVVPLIVLLFCTGMRLSEAVYLNWSDVDLVGGRVIVWADRTKSGKRRNVMLPTRGICALANLPHRDGRVFRWAQQSRKDGPPTGGGDYADRGGRYGGQIKTAWRGAIRRAGLDPELSPHSCRHSWASWHYAVHKDLLRLQVEGGWSSVKLVERYAHLLPGGQQTAIRQFWGIGDEVVTGFHDYALSS